jgi:hypothetical protein
MLYRDENLTRINKVHSCSYVTAIDTVLFLWAPGGDNNYYLENSDVGLFVWKPENLVWQED